TQDSRLQTLLSVHRYPAAGGFSGGRFDAIRGQNRLYLAGHKIDADGVEPTLWNNDVGVALGRLYELKMHRAHGVGILLDHGLERPPALVNISIQPANEPNIGIGIDKDLQVHQSAQSRVAEDQDSLEDDYRPGLDMGDLGPARMRLVVVDRLLYWLAGFQRFNMIDQQIGVESIRMIEVDVVAQLDRHIAQVAIIGILLQVDHARGADRLYYSVGDGGLSRPRSPSYPD